MTMQALTYCHLPDLFLQQYRAKKRFDNPNTTYKLSLDDTCYHLVL